MEQSIDSWVNNSPAGEKEFRRAVRVILKAISLDEELSETMVMKGGILLGIKYNSSRYTTDIDFSTSEHMGNLNIEEFKKELNDRLLEAQALLIEDLKCVVQSIKKQPKKNPEATFPSLKISIGYANKNSIQQMRRLENSQSPAKVSIDYSFNEVTGETERLEVDHEDEEYIRAYSLVSLIAEKIRSVLQQTVRNRSRRQDIYDLYLLIEYYSENSRSEKVVVLETLLKKSEGKGIDHLLHKNGLDCQEIIERSSRDYSLLENEIKGDLPEFSDAYSLVIGYYKSLPWEIV